MKNTGIEGLHYQSGKPLSIGIVDGCIGSIVGKERLDNTEYEDIFVAPGLIDNQVNGYKSIGFSSPDLTVEGVRSVTRSLWKYGVTTYLPTVITGPHDRLVKSFSVMSAALNESDIASSVSGFHLEGPYISPESGYRGAHNPEWIRPPDWNEFQELNEAAGKRILQVTMAPEIDGAMDFIEKCVQNGIVVGLGHHNASAPAIKEAADRGAMVSTHLGNGCATMIHRHENPLWPQLAEDRLMASIIVDGFHLLPEEVQVIYKVKGSRRLVIVSDVTELAGMPPGEYPWNNDTLVVTPEGMIQYPNQNVLAGASFPLHRGLQKMMEFTGCTLGEAIQMASTNPARLNSLNDRGEMKQDKRADLILFRAGDTGLEIKKTIIAGKEVYSAETE